MKKKKLFYNLLYLLLETKSVKLKKYINENLAQKFI